VAGVLHQFDELAVELAYDFGRPILVEKAEFLA
jgi:hypothetical protein